MTERSPELSRGTVPPKEKMTYSNEDDNKIITLNVQIMGKDFQVSCPASEQDDLVDSAAQLDKRMRDIRDTGKVIGLERIAIMAGLNLSHEFLQTKDQVAGKETSDMLKTLNKKLDNALQSAKQMQI